MISRFIFSPVKLNLLNYIGYGCFIIAAIKIILASGVANIFNTRNPSDKISGITEVINHKDVPVQTHKETGTQFYRKKWVSKVWKDSLHKCCFSWSFRTSIILSNDHIWYGNEWEENPWLFKNISLTITRESEEGLKSF